MRKLVAALLITAAAPASAAGVFTLASDAEFIGYENAAVFTKYGSTTIQWGNGGPSGNWEYAIRGPSDGVTLGQGQIDWSNGGHNLAPGSQPYVSYSPMGELSMALNVIENGNNPNGNPTGSYISSGLIQTGANTLLLRAITTNNANPGAVELRGITVSFLSGGSINLGDLLGDSNAAYVGLADLRLASGFTINITSGKFDWDASASNARPSLQVKVGQTQIAVPEPATLGLLGLGVLAIGIGRRRRA